MTKQQIPFDFRLRKAQSRVYHHPARFRVLVAGRRFGKTQLALVELLRATWLSPGATAWYIAPTYRQAKTIAWERLKSMLRDHTHVQISETELTIRFPGNRSIVLRGADQYHALRGSGLDFVVLDEFAGMKPEVWPEVIRPALADRHGRALFIGTPHGHNHFYDRFLFAQSDPDWSAFQFTTLDGGYVGAQELAGAARELDQRLYRQEFEASFENNTLGRAYHAFSRHHHVSPCRYRPGAKLIWSLDFNVHPMCSILAQRNDDLQQSIPHYLRDPRNDEVQILDEIVIEDANTLLACQRLWDRISPWRFRGAHINLDIYGDASGYQRRTSGTTTDWNLIREFFTRYTGQVTARVKAASSNPCVRDRVNLVNSRLLNAAGDRQLYIDPKCKHLILDLERVCWSVDRAGQPTSELDKSDRMRTHTSDALGYYLAQIYPLYGKIGEKQDRLF